MIIPQKEYKKVKGGSGKLQTFIRKRFALPCIPKNITKPSATRRAGMHIGIADIESKNFLPKNFLLAVKNAAEIPMINASNVEKKACFKVKIVVFHNPSILECALFPVRLD